MSLLEDLIASVHSSNDRVKRIVYGPRWILVEGTRCGLARNFGNPETPRIDQTLAGKPMADLLKMALSDESCEAAVGLASLNSLLIAKAEFESFRISYLPRASGKRVMIVGQVSFMDNLRETAAEVRSVSPEEIRNSQDLEAARRDMVLISANHVPLDEIENLLELTGSAYTIIFGAPTPLSPLVFNYGCDQLVGAMVTNPEQAINQVLKADEDFELSAAFRPVVMARHQQSR